MPLSIIRFDAQVQLTNDIGGPSSAVRGIGGGPRRPDSPLATIDLSGGDARIVGSGKIDYLARRNLDIQADSEWFLTTAGHPHGAY